MKINFEFEKETKGTMRFKEVANDPVIGTLYIKKKYLEELGVSGAGDKLEVTIEKVE